MKAGRQAHPYAKREVVAVFHKKEKDPDYSNNALQHFDNILVLIVIIQHCLEALQLRKKLILKLELLCLGLLLLLLRPQQRENLRKQQMILMCKQKCREQWMQWQMRIPEGWQSIQMQLMTQRLPYNINNSLKDLILRTEYDLPDYAYGFKVDRITNWKQIQEYQYYLAMAEEIRSVLENQ